MNSNMLSSLRLSLLLAICFVLFFTTAAQSFQVTIDGSALSVNYIIRNMSTGQRTVRQGIATLDLSAGTYRFESGQKHLFDLDNGGILTVSDPTAPLLGSGTTQLTVDPSRVRLINIDGSAIPQLNYRIRDLVTSTGILRQGIVQFNALPGTYRFESGQKHLFDLDNGGILTVSDPTAPLLGSGTTQLTVDPSKVLQINIDGSALTLNYRMRDLATNSGILREGIVQIDALPGSYRIEHSGNTASFAVDSNCNLTPPPPYSLGGIPVPVTCGGANSPPVANCKDIDLDLDASGQATLDPSDVDDGSSDPDGDPITLSLDRTAFDCDDLGPQTVTLTVTDDKGASASCQTTVTVKDVTRPTLSVLASPSSLWPPNHKYQAITLTLTASDACDPSPAVSAVVVSSEPDDAKGNGDGNTTGDIKVTTTGGGILLSSNDDPEVPWKPGEQLELRAERGGKGNGRVYTITVTAKDASGNETPATVEISVTHDKGKAAKPVAGVGVEGEKLILGDDPDAFDASLGARFGHENSENLKFRLYQNSPNPFNPTTTIRYSLAELSDVHLTIYNALGQAVRLLVNTNQSTGRYNVNWDGRDASGKLVASGLYIYRLKAGTKVAVRKMIFAK